MAAMAGLGAAALAKATEPVARATDGAALIVGQTNTSTVNTELDRTAPFANLSACFTATTNTGRALNGFVSTINNGDFGVYGSANGFADLGHSAGVMGTSNFAHGVIGSAFINQGQPINYGVLAQNIGAGIGLRADSGRASGSPTIGVLGVAGDPGSSALNPPTAAAAVYGLSNSGAAGVVGQSNPGVGCQGSSSGNVGVLGTSSQSIGVFASSTNSTGSTPPRPTAPASSRAPTTATPSRAPRTATWACSAPRTPASAATSPPGRPPASTLPARRRGLPHASMALCS
jgi:hypothetical protein